MATTRFVQKIGNVVPRTVFLRTKHQSFVFFLPRGNHKWEALFGDGFTLELLPAIIRGTAKIVDNVCVCFSISFITGDGICNHAVKKMRGRIYLKFDPCNLRI